MTSGRASSIAAIVTAIVITGCGRESDQPWRKALDEGKVYKLGGGVGPVSPNPNPAPAVVVTPPVVIQGQPPGLSSSPKPKAVDDLPVPAPPTAADKKPVAPASKQNDDPSLGPPR